MHGGTNDLRALVRAAHRLTTALFCKALLETPLFTWLQVKAILLDIFADTFPFNLAAETTKCLLKRLILSNSDEDQGVLQCGP